jgi:hypothetical protein
MSLIRKNRFEYIEKSLNILDDEMITSIYDKISSITKKALKKGNIERIDKIQYIEENIKNINDIDLESFVNTIEESFEESDEDRKIRVALELINKILIAIGKKKIKDLCKFIDVRRDLLLSKEIQEIIEKNKRLLFEETGFNKKDCNAQPSKAKYPHFAILRGIIRECGYDLVSKNKTKHIDKEIKMITQYSIIKKEED